MDFRTYIEYFWVTAVLVPYYEMNDCFIFHQTKEGEPWREKETEANSSNIHIQNLEYDASYEAEVFAVNINGLSKPEKVYFTTPQGKYGLQW